MMKLFFLALLCLLTGCRATVTTWYVNGKQGADAANGQSPEEAFATIQHAVDMAQPGDLIRVAPGIYHEIIQWKRAGTAETPIRLEAEATGSYETVISGADPDLRNKRVVWELVDAELALYKVPLNHHPVRVLAGGVDVPAYPNLDDLKAFRFLEDDYPGTRHGFAWDEATQSLYIRLFADGRYGPVDPNERVMAVAPPTAGGRWGTDLNRPDNFLLRIDLPEAAHVVIEGFTFETPGLAGIYAASDEVTVRDCWFFGCRYGISGTADGSTANVTVENCFYTQYPAFSDCEEVILREADTQRHKSPWWQKLMHWQRKGGFPPSSRGIGSAYAYETGLVRRMGYNWTVCGNWLWETFEGFSSGSTSVSRDSRICDNRIERVCDNGVETEDHARGLTVSGNLLIDVFEPFSWQPMWGLPLPGDIVITDNIVLQTPEVTRLWERAGNQGGIVKMGCKDDRNWELRDMGDAPRDVTTAPGGFWFAHNTVLVPRGRLLTALNPPGRRYAGFYFFNNIIATEDLSQYASLDRLSGIVFTHNAVWLSQAGTTDIRAASGPGGFVAPSLAALDMDGTEPGEEVPASASPAVSLGLTRHTVTLPDGATLDIPERVSLRATVGAQPFDGSAGPLLSPSPTTVTSSILIQP